MKKEKTKVYTYTRVSTAMQVDGYSLDAQKAKMKAYADYNDYEIVGEYEDAGKSGKSIEGRAQFSQMMEDIKSGKDGVSYVLVFKLSRFGRNAADVLSSLQVMQDFGVNLVCVEDGIDSSKDAGKLMISVLSAVAEIERENIRVQTMEGRIQKAREGRWNGGFAPYGYRLVDGKLIINEEEAEIVRLIFQKYVYEGYGVKRICNYLVENNIMGRNGKNIPTTTLVRMVRNKTYLGYLINGNVEKECPELRIIEPEVFEKAQELRDARRREKGEDSDSYSPHALLCGKVFCAHCGNRLNITSSGRTRLRADGSTVKEKRFRYSCHYNVRHPGQCDGQSGYGVTKLDAIVESIVCTKFSEILECSKSKLLQDMLRKDMEVAQKEVSRAKSELDLKDDERNALKDEMIRVIRGKSSIDRDMIQQLLDENQAAIQAAQDALTAAQNKLEEIEQENKKAENDCSNLFTWASTYQNASFQQRQAILNQFIKEVRVGRDYDIEIILNVPLEEFEEFKSHSLSVRTPSGRKTDLKQAPVRGLGTPNGGIVVFDKTSGEAMNIMPKSSAHVTLRCQDE